MTVTEDPRVVLPVSPAELDGQLPVAPELMARADLQDAIDRTPIGVRDTLAQTAMEWWMKASSYIDAFNAVRQRILADLVARETARRSRLGQIIDRIADLRQELASLTEYYREAYSNFKANAQQGGCEVEPAPQAIYGAVCKKHGIDPARHADLMAQVARLQVPTQQPAYPAPPATIIDDGDLPPTPVAEVVPPKRVVERPAQLAEAETLRHNNRLADEGQHGVMDWLAIVLTGMVFGPSLAVFFGFLQVRNLMQGQTASLLMAAGFVCLGAGILWATGTAFRWLFSQIAEWHYQVSPARSDGSRPFPAAFLFFTILMAIWLAETFVEKGAVLTYLTYMAQRSARFSNGTFARPSELNCWLAGLIVCSPILIYKIVSGWRSVARRLTGQGHIDQVVTDLEVAWRSEDNAAQREYDEAVTAAQTRFDQASRARATRITEILTARRAEYDAAVAELDRQYTTAETARQAALVEAQASLNAMVKGLEAVGLYISRHTALGVAMGLVKPIMDAQARLVELGQLIEQAERDAASLFAMSTPDPIMIGECDALRRQIVAAIANMSRLATGMPLDAEAAPNNP